MFDIIIPSEEFCLLMFHVLFRIAKSAVTGQIYENVPLRLHPVHPRLCVPACFSARRQ